MDKLEFSKTKSYWLDSTTIPSYRVLDDKIKVDIGIVGAGITGITAAYLFAKEGLNVCVLDSKAFLHGTTGHTTAKITQQHGLIYDELIQHVGIEKAKQYYEANKRAQQFIEETVKSLHIDCDFRQEDAYLYTTSNDEVKKLEQEYKAYEELGIPGELSANTPLPFTVKTALKMEHQATFHPLQYLSALIKKCEEFGVKLYDHTRAVTVEFAKHPAIVTESGQRIICNFVIQASHFPFYDGMGFYPTKMYQDRSYVLAVKPTVALIEGLYKNVEQPSRSIRPIIIDGEDALLISGESHKTGQTKNDFINHYDNLYTFARENFNIEKIYYRWSTQDLVTLDKIPYVGRLEKGHHNVFVATGYRKWGMTNGTNAAMLLYETIMEKDSPYVEVFSPSRTIKPDPSIRKLVTFNTDVAKHLIKGKLQRPTSNLTTLKRKEACITTIKNERAGVYKDDEDNLHAVDTTCTHMGCELNWNDAEKSWDCPCHGSRFHYDGTVINGPAVKNLTKLDLEEEV